MSHKLPASDLKLNLGDADDSNAQTKYLLQKYRTMLQQYLKTPPRETTMNTPPVRHSIRSSVMTSESAYQTSPTNYYSTFTPTVLLANASQINESDRGYEYDSPRSFPNFDSNFGIREHAVDMKAYSSG
jgi:hypothetical protein